MLPLLLPPWKRARRKPPPPGDSFDLRGEGFFGDFVCNDTGMAGERLEPSGGLPDESDPNNLDKGEGGSDVCRDLPTLWSNADETLAMPTSSPGEAQTGAEAPMLLAQAQPDEASSQLSLLLKLAGLFLAASGALALLIVWRQHGSSGESQ